MNELGLTRDSVRAEIKAIVEAEARKAVRMLVDEGKLEAMVHGEFELAIRSNQWDRDALKKMIMSAAEKKMHAYIENFVEKRLKFTPPETKSA